MIIIAYFIFREKKTDYSSQHKSHTSRVYYDDYDEEDYDYYDDDINERRKSDYSRESRREDFEDNPYYDGPEIDDYDRVERYAWMEENDPEDFEDMW